MSHMRHALMLRFMRLYTSKHRRFGVPKYDLPHRREALDTIPRPPDCVTVYRRMMRPQAIDFFVEQNSPQRGVVSRVLPV